MSKYHGGRTAKSGFYWNTRTWAITMTERQGGVLPGDGQDRYTRIPVVAMLLVAPFMGAAYVLFLPFIGIAMVVDTLDGFFARLTNSSTAFGVELDSLADVVSFGLAPAILAFTWGLWPLQRVGWAVGFLFVSAAALRLARFNIQTGNVTDKRYFVGMPSPAAAAVIASTVYLYPDGLHDRRRALLALAYLVVFGSSVAFATYFYLLRHWEATRVATSTYVNPVVALVLGVVFLGETVTFGMVTGTAVVLAGVALVLHEQRRPDKT